MTAFLRGLGKRVSAFDIFSDEITGSRLRDARHLQHKLFTSFTLCPKYLEVLLNINEFMKESQLDGSSFKHNEAQTIITK